MISFPWHLSLPLVITAACLALAVRAVAGRRRDRSLLTPVLGVILLIPAALSWAVYFAILYSAK
ncbi:MAG: hypothetical protein LBC18_03265 [Opitutaceae bacterium]|jgi:hypothetical protein|nr:hypothetical protein [Opitutaceae bacterium]